MPPYQFETPQNRYVGTLANLIAQSGDPQARAAEVGGNAQARAIEIGGNAWAGAARDAGAIVGALPERIAAQKTQALRDTLLASEVDQRNAQAAATSRAAKGQQLLGQLTQQYGDDTDAIAKGLTAQGYGDAAEKFVRGATQTAEDRAKLKALKAQSDAALASAVGKAANRATSPDEFMADIDHLVLGGQLGADDRQKFVQSLQQAGPTGWDAWKQRTVKWADDVVPAITQKEGETRRAGVSGTVLSESTSRKTPAELAADAANPNSPTQAQSTTALDLLKPPKAEPAPRSLDEQLLQAITSGDKATADRITQTMKTAAAAKGDPAAIAAANRQASTIAAQIAQQGRAQGFTEAQAGRGELTNKVEAPYLDAREKADTLRNVVALAKSGNKEAANVQGLLGVLGLVTSEGVKRINTTELDQVAGAGSLFDKIKGRAGSIASGQPIPEDLQNDLVQLSNMLEQSARKKYENGFKQVKTRYGLKDETALAPTGSPDKGTAGTIGGKPAVWDYRNDTWGWWPQ